MAGRRPVEEAFAAGRTAHRLVVVPQRRGALEQLVLHATRLRIPIVEVEGGSLTALAGFDGHQGIALVVDPRRYASPEEILARAAERGEPPFVLVLDSLEDPQNVGTLLRSAEAAGVHGVIFPTRRQAPLTPAAVKASAGAVEHLLLCPVDDLAGALADLHAQGLRVAGSEAGAPLTARQTDLRGPIAIVVGSEGQGLGPAIRRRCDLFMRIPMRGSVGSLNAAVAGSVLLFEALAQRDPDDRGRPQADRRQGRTAAGRQPVAETEADLPDEADSAARAEVTAEQVESAAPTPVTTQDPQSSGIEREPDAQAEPAPREAEVEPEADAAASESIDREVGSDADDSPAPAVASAPPAESAPRRRSPAARLKPSSKSVSGASDAESADADAESPDPDVASPSDDVASVALDPGSAADTPEPAAAQLDGPPSDSDDDLLPGGPPPGATPPAKARKPRAPRTPRA